MWELGSALPNVVSLQLLHISLETYRLVVVIVDPHCQSTGLGGGRREEGSGRDCLYDLRKFQTRQFVNEDGTRAEVNKAWGTMYFAI